LKTIRDLERSATFDGSEGGMMRAKRRQLLGAAIAIASCGPAMAARPGPATLLVPGPADGFAVRWTYGIVRALIQGAAAPRIDAQVLGGADGVTAANRFAATAAEGQTLLVLNGAAAQARLVGESRARFDPAGWLPVCAGVTPVMVVGARPMCGCERLVRLGLPAPAAAETVALLVLEQLGIAASPVFGLAGADALAALEAGRIDAAVLPAPGRFVPWFALGPGPDPDPEHAEVPLAATLVADAAGALRAAILAAGAAASLEGVLVLPALTEADRLARWRVAAQRWVDTAEPGGPRRLAGAAAGALLAATMPPPPAMLAYREWLLRRLAWQAQ